VPLPISGCGVTRGWVTRRTAVARVDGGVWFGGAGCIQSNAPFRAVIRPSLLRSTSVERRQPYLLVVLAGSCLDPSLLALVVRKPRHSSVFDQVEIGLYRVGRSTQIAATCGRKAPPHLCKHTSVHGKCLAEPHRISHFEQTTRQLAEKGTGRDLGHEKKHRSNNGRRGAWRGEGHTVMSRQGPFVRPLVAGCAMLPDEARV
jgi:hypothetical protein